MHSALRLLLVLFCPLALLHAAGPKPNILFIVGDDMGYADVGFHGCKDIPTPNLDALAASGVRFTNGYVSGPYCSPTRAGLMTGRYQTRFGHEFNSGSEGSGGLPLTEKTIANRLKEAGYTTGIVGKWHLGSGAGMHPQERGFDEFFGFLAGGHSYFDKNGILRGREQVQEMDYATDAFGREAAAFVERHKHAPWFLYLAFNAVHTPMHATPDRLEKFPSAEGKRREYNAMMLAMDEAIGKVRQKIADAGLEKNTLVCFISDNGGPTMQGVTVNGSKNDPLRGSKRTTLEGGVRVPYLVSWPARVKPGVFEQPVIQLDLTRTALAAAGVEALPEWKLEGADLVPFLSGEKTGAPHDALYWRFGNQKAIRMGDYKLVSYDGTADGVTTGKPNRKEEGKIVGPVLYNLKDDLHETKDLSSAMPDKVKELEAKWDAWNAGNVEPAWKSVRGGGEDATAPAKKRKKKAE
jgi:arylsulfatase A-like enzyme